MQGDGVRWVRTPPPKKKTIKCKKISYKSGMQGPMLPLLISYFSAFITTEK